MKYLDFKGADYKLLIKCNLKVILDLQNRGLPLNEKVSSYDIFSALSMAVHLKVQECLV